MKKYYCCEQLENFTAKTSTEFQDTDKLIYYSEKFEEFGLIIHDGGLSYVAINFCPWSGDKLPISKRERWFDELERLGYDNPIGDFNNIPEDFKTRRWLDKLEK